MDGGPAFRAEWLVRLVEAVEGAQQLAWELRTHESASADARQLYSRLEAVRLELKSLQGVSRDRPLILEPDWLTRFGWASDVLGSAD